MKPFHFNIYMYRLFHQFKFLDKEFDAAKNDVESQKSAILKKGEKSYSDMKKKAEGKVDAAADKFIKDFLESLS